MKVGAAIFFDLHPYIVAPIGATDYMQHLVLYTVNLFILQYSRVYMDQLELVFQLLGQMYLQYNVHLSIVVCTYYIIYIYMHVIQNNLRTPQLVGEARQLGYKNPLPGKYKQLVKYRSSLKIMASRLCMCIYVCMYVCMYVCTVSRAHKKRSG